MDVLFWGLTLGVIGKVLLGASVIMVHGKIVHEHRIDKVVLHEMRRERDTALLGVALMVSGYLLEMTHFGYISF